MRYRVIVAALVCLCAATCSSPSAPSISAPRPDAPATNTAIVAVSSLSADAEPTATGAIYRTSLQLKETGGRSGATISAVNYTLQSDTGKFTATYTPATTQHVSAGGSLDFEPFRITDDSGPSATIASQLSVAVRFVDDGGREGSATGTASISKPAPLAPAPAIYTVNGQVTDGTSGGVLPNIVLRVLTGANTGKSATTDAGGNYAIAGIAADALTLSASATSYQTTSKQVTVSGDTRVDFVLPRCRYNLATNSQSVPAAGSSNTVQVTADATCPWTATSNAAWITVTGAASGAGNGSIAYAAAANSGAARSGTLTIAGETLTVTQAAAPAPPAPTPTPPAPAPPAPTPPAPTPPAPVPPAPPVNLTGTWNGTGNDSQGATTVTWALTQTGATVSGTVRTLAINPNDGSCNSCHRNKSGTFSGTIAGTTLTMTMFFAAGASGDPTPACSQTITATAAAIAGDSFSSVYSGADTCEGGLNNGTLTMTRRP